MARTNSTAQNRIDPTRPFFAAVGGVDIAVEYARNGINDAQSRLSKVELEPRALADQGRTVVVTRVDELQSQAKALPSKAQSVVNGYVAELSETVDDLNKQYVDLAARGRKLVNRIRGQQATQDLKAAAKNTKSSAKRTATETKKTAGTASSSARSAAKRTATQTKKTASTAKSSAKATGTSAKKTASAAKKTAAGAAKKTGR